MVDRKYTVIVVARQFLNACRTEGGGIEENWDWFIQRVWPVQNDDAKRMQDEVWHEAMRMLRKNDSTH